jgi:negative regulator of flagellin synthesis FlgM
MSVEFFGVGGPGQIGSLKKSQKIQGAGEDKVQFSSVLQDVHRAKAATASGDAERAARVKELQAQIKEGSYQPDLQKVSASLLQFLVENR